MVLKCSASSIEMSSRVIVEPFCTSLSANVFSDSSRICYKDNFRFNCKYIYHVNMMQTSFSSLKCQ